MNSKSKDKDQDSSWGSCPTGTLENMVGRLSVDRGRQQQRHIVRVYGVLLFATVVCVGGAFLVNQAQTPELPLQSSLTCAECIQYMAAYRDGVLDAKLTQLVRSHLDACDYCRQIYETKYSVERAQVTMSLAMSWPR